MNTRTFRYTILIAIIAFILIAWAVSAVEMTASVPLTKDNCLTTCEA